MSDRLVYEWDVASPFDFTDADGAKARAYAEEQRDLTAGLKGCGLCGGRGFIQPTRPAFFEGRVERVPAGEPYPCPARCRS